MASMRIRRCKLQQRHTCASKKVIVCRSRRDATSVAIITTTNLRAQTRWGEAGAWRVEDMLTQGSDR